MSFMVPKFRNEKILGMTDDELFTEIKRLKRLIYKQRKAGEKHAVRRAEEEMCYLQAEAQNRGHKV